MTLRAVWPALAFLFVAATVLELVVRTGLLAATVLPPPTAIVAAFGDLWRDHTLVGPALLTLGETLGSALIAAVVGIPVGFALARSRSFGRAYETWLGGLVAAPLVLVYPLFLVIFHRTTLMIVVFSAVTAVLPAIIQTRTGFLLVPAVYKNVGRSFNLSGWDTFRLIELPAAVPAIATGLRLAIIYALVSTMGLEFLIDFGGLGRVISDLYAQFDIPQMYAGIVTIVALSFVLLWSLDRVERWLRPA